MNIRIAILSDQFSFSGLYIDVICPYFGSWVPQANQYRVMQFVGYYTDPYLNVFRRFIPPLGMFDISPIVAFLCLSFIQNLVMNFLLRLV